MEFHHVNPKEKEFEVSGHGLMQNLEVIISELRKCIMVCSNCHRGIHSNDVLVPANWKDYFDETTANNLLNDNKSKKETKKYYCLDCGKEISYGSVRCPVCVGKRNRVAERPDREELKNMIRTLPFKTIAQNYGLTDNAIRGWCENYHLPTKKHEIINYSDEEWKMI